MSLLVISQADVGELLSMEDCIGLMRDAFQALAKGDVVLPLRPVMMLPDRRGVLAMMPGYVADPETIAAKVLTFFPGNLDSPYDAHQGAVLLFDPKHGRLVGLLDASEITAIRTAAATAVATDLLARPDACDLAILGSGVQAHKHLDAMRAVRKISRVRVWSRTPEHAQRFARREAQRLMIQIKVTETAEEAVRGADIVCTTTTARNPIVFGDWISEGAHINAVGSCSPTARELDTSTIVRSRMFVDWRESTLKEAGDFLIPKQEGAVDDRHIVGEVGEVLLGRVEGRTSSSDVTLFKSLGVAIQDAVAAHYVHQKARDTRVGVRVDFGGAR
jgi:ornithine cyclodeaminase/alanine dehydrogenase-like protein (mu-crystallin family)